MVQIIVTNYVQIDQLFLVNKCYVGGYTEFRNLKNILLV